jgi:uroporphyrinogen-III decarboxylase
MTPREQILKLLKGEKPDNVPWFGDLDYLATKMIALKEKPENFKSSDDYIEWHRKLGVGFYLQGYYPFKIIFENCTVKEWKDGYFRFKEIQTPLGTLKECWQYLPDSFSEAPIEHLIKDTKDLKTLRYIYENARYEPDYDFAAQRLQQVKEMGIVLCYLPKSPFMRLVAEDAGIMAVTYIQAEEPEEFAETLLTMEKSFDKAAQIAIDSPAEVLMIPENLSSEMVGPKYFEKYMRTIQEKWIKQISQAGKYSFIHLDGTMRGLLREESSTGISVLEALTPKPVGDVPIEDWAEMANNPKTILWGGIPGIYFTPLIDDSEFDRHVINVLEVMRTSPRYVLGVADQVPPDGLEERIKRVSELVKIHGKFA